MKKILLILLMLALPSVVMGQFSTPSVGGGADADSLKGIPLQDTTSNLLDNYIMKWNLSVNQWEYEVDAGGASPPTLEQVFNFMHPDYADTTGKNDSIFIMLSDSSAVSAHATEADSAGKSLFAQQDADGDSINVSDYLTATGVVVSDSNALSADSSGKSLFAQQDADGDSINVSDYLTATGVVVADSNALSADSAGKALFAQQDADGDSIDVSTYSTGAHTPFDSAEVYLISRDSLGGTATRTDNYVLKIDTDPTPDSFYWDVAGAGGGDDVKADTAGDGTNVFDLTNPVFKKGSGIQLVVDDQTIDTLLIQLDTTQFFPFVNGVSWTTNDVVFINANDSLDFVAQAGASGTADTTIITDGVDSLTGLGNRLIIDIGSGLDMSTSNDSAFVTVNDSMVGTAELGDSLGNYIDSASVHDSLDVIRVEMGDTARVAAGDSARVVTLNEVNNPTASKTFGMGALGLKFLYTGAVATAYEIEATGVFTGDMLHIHQHTGNVGATNLLVLEAEDTDVTNLRIDNTVGTDTLSIFTGGLSMFDSVSVAGALRADGALNFAVDAVVDSMIPDGITIDSALVSAHATEADSAGLSAFAQNDADGDSIDISILLTTTDPTYTGLLSGDSAKFIGNVNMDSMDVAGAADFNGTLKMPVANAPAPVIEGEIIWDGDDPGTETTDGTTDYFSDVYKSFLLNIDNPDGLTCDTIKIPIRGTFPGGIVIDSIGILTSTTGSYSVVFQEWTDIDHSTGTESAIATVATTTSFEQASGGIAHTVEYDNLIAIDLPATDIDQVIIWIRYYMLGKD